MSKKTPSQDFSYEFEVVFDKEKETTLQKIKRWINKKEPPLRTILSYLFSYVEKWYWEGKLKQTMSGVDSEVEKIHDVWDDELRTEQPIELEEKITRNKICKENFISYILSWKDDLLFSHNL